MMSTQRTLGILSPLVGNTYFGGVLRTLQQVAVQHGARAIAVQTRDPWALHSEDEGIPAHEYNCRLAWEHVDGWIAVSDAAPLDYLQSLTKTGTPLVLLNWSHAELTCPAVQPDNYHGAQQAVLHLLEHGHTQIAFVGFQEHPNIRARHEGYVAALAQYGIAPNPDLNIPASDMIIAGGMHAATQLLAAQVPFTAVIAGTDLNAYGLMEAFRQAGVRIPEDVAVVGFDDIEVAEFMVPPLTTVRQSFEQVARTAGELLFAKLAGDTVANGAHYTPCSLVIRSSCGCQTQPEAIVDSPDILVADTWQEQLRMTLVQLVQQAYNNANGAPQPITWPGAQTLAQGAAAAIAGNTGPSSQAYSQAWQEAVAFTQHLPTLRLIISHLSHGARRQISPTDSAAQERLDRFLDLATSQMFNARLRSEIQRNLYFGRIIENIYDTTSAILIGEADALQKLNWLHHAGAKYGYLGLWDATRANLRLAGIFNQTGDMSILGTIYQPQQFPPHEVLQLPESPGEMLMFFPVRTSKRDWGILAIHGPIESELASGRSTFSQATAVLSVALEREELFQSIVAQQAELRTAYEYERFLTATIREIGTPVIPLLPQVLLVPLIGSIDTARAQQVLTAVLEQISQAHATDLLLDLTGVPLVDTQVAGALLQLAQAAQLLGAKTILVGVRPEIAQSLVSLGIDLQTIETQSTLSAAIMHLLHRRIR